jgi:hypothetical protein
LGFSTGLKLISYRVYRLNSQGRIVSGEWIEAGDDAEASRLAHLLCDDSTPSVEIWQGARRIGVLPCAGDGVAA